MKTQLFGIIASLVLIGCGTAETTTKSTPTGATVPTFTAPTELAGYVADYIALCEETDNGCTIANLSVEWTDKLPDDVAAVCYLSWNGDRLSQNIKVLRSETENGRDSMMLLMAHELQHCIRFNDHTLDNKPHVMRTYLMNEEEFSKKPIRQWIMESFQWNRRIAGY